MIAWSLTSASLYIALWMSLAYMNSFPEKLFKSVGKGRAICTISFSMKKVIVASGNMGDAELMNCCRFLYRGLELRLQRKRDKNLKN